jgi:hypothetical protein
VAQLEARLSGKEGSRFKDHLESLRAGPVDPELGDVGSSAENIGGSGNTIPVSEDGCDWISIVNGEDLSSDPYTP